MTVMVTEHGYARNPVMFGAYSTGLRTGCSSRQGCFTNEIQEWGHKRCRWMAGDLLVVEARTACPESPDRCARTLEVPDKMGQHVSSRVVIHGGAPGGISLEMSNVCTLGPGAVPDMHSLFIIVGTSPTALDIPEHGHGLTMPVVSGLSTPGTLM
ncbi:hypothetical protein EDD15DRAFT_2302114 [Pisolithus albus]|nr:hypothetical protein EDD15DRAFT_2302114 [Pisolithus albus]